jgi:hypothetical protein
MKQHHSLDPKVAEQVGINAALLIWNLSYLQSQRESQGGDDFYHEGKWWVRHSYESLAEWHNYLSIPQIKRIMKKLEDDGHISKASLGKNPWDRTTYWHVSPVFMHSTESHHASDASVPSDSTKSYDVQQKNNKVTKRKFVPPTLEECIAYANEKKFVLCPKHFFEFYSAGDWHDSYGTPVKNWKQKYITRNKDEVRRNGQYNSTQPNTEAPIL